MSVIRQETFRQYTVQKVVTGLQERCGCHMCNTNSTALVMKIEQYVIMIMQGLTMKTHECMRGIGNSNPRQYIGASDYSNIE